MSLPILEVVWCDSYIYEPGWLDVENLPEPTVVHRAIGYVLNESKKDDETPACLTLAVTISDDGSRAAGIVTIPLPAIFFRKSVDPMKWRLEKAP
jgi:hypothetical protein